MATEEVIEFKMEDVARNNGKNGAPSWIVIKDKVYDVTKYIQEHPGGVDVLEEVLGQDATKAFDDVGHSSDATSVLKKLKIGELVEEDRKYKKKKKKETVEGEEEKEQKSCLSIITCGLC